jgi:SAM-dependent methyltransferase
MEQNAPDINVIKQKMADTWANGDFGAIAHTLMPAAEDFVNSLGIEPGNKVLDVACGSGNLAVLAAQKGADVKGIDIVDDLVRQSKERAAENNLNIEFTVGDAEDMPYSDNEFDFVITMFGAMFCPRPDVTAKELFRVCKPGGKVAMANWTQNAFAEDFFGTIKRFAPPPPPGVSPPNQWGDEEIVKQRLGPYASDIQLTLKSFEIVYPVSPAETTEKFTKYFGPIKSLYDNMDEAVRREFTDAITGVFTKHNISTAGNNVMVGDYLEVIATKA